MAKRGRGRLSYLRTYIQTHTSSVYYRHRTHYTTPSAESQARRNNGVFGEVIEVIELQQKSDGFECREFPKGRLILKLLRVRFGKIAQHKKVNWGILPGNYQAL